MVGGTFFALEIGPAALGQTGRCGSREADIAKEPLESALIPNVVGSENSGLRVCREGHERDLNQVGPLEGADAGLLVVGVLSHVVADAQAGDGFGLHERVGLSGLAHVVLEQPPLDIEALLVFAERLVDAIG